MSECPDCHGSGVVNDKAFSGGWERKTCHMCEGRGMLSSIKVDYSYISKPKIHLCTRRQQPSPSAAKRTAEKRIEKPGNEETVWRKAQKRPLIVKFRPVHGEKEVIVSPEGAAITVYRNTHLVMRDEAGEYPILGTVFAKTYDVLPEWLQKWKSHEPFWKNDLIGRIWSYARSNGLVIIDAARDDAGRETLPKGLGDLIRNIRMRCDRCGKTPEEARRETDDLIGIDAYQCCWIHTIVEDYAPKLCLACHDEMKRIWPHATTSV